MTKQTTATAAPEEKPTAELLLRRFKMMDELVADVRKKNIEAGLDPKYMDNYIQWPELFGKKRYDKWIASVTNPKRKGKFYQIKELKDAGFIPEDESENENKTYPYRTISALFKIKTREGVFLFRHEQWVGLTKSGNELTVPVLDLDWITKPPVTYDYIPADPKNPEGSSIRVGIVRMAHNIEQPLGTMPRKWLTPFSKEKVDECIRYAAGPLNQVDGTSLIMIKEGVNSPVMATYEQFIAPPEQFDTIFEEIRKPVPKFDDFFKGYKKAVAETDADQYR